MKSRARRKVREMYRRETRRTLGRGRVRLAIVAVLVQLALDQARLLVPDGFGGDVWAAISDHAYELAPFWAAVACAMPFAWPGLSGR